MLTITNALSKSRVIKVSSKIPMSSQSSLHSSTFIVVSARLAAAELC